MLTYDIESSEWVEDNYPMRGPRNVMSALDRWVFHYRGVPGVQVPADPLQALRNMQRSWTNDPGRGYSLGYDEALVSAEGHAMDGMLIEVRGTEIRGAATGGINAITWATVVFIVEDGKTGLSPKAKARCRARSLELRIASPKISGPERVFGHGWSGSTTTTSCPGIPISDDLRAGSVWAFDPEDDDDMADNPYRNGVLAVYVPEGAWIAGRHLGYFVRFTSGHLAHLTGPDFWAAHADPDFPIALDVEPRRLHPIQGKEHYNQLVEQARVNGSSLKPI